MVIKIRVLSIIITTINYIYILYIIAGVVILLAIFYIKKEHLFIQTAAVG